MDIDRRRAEAMEARRKPRLIEENEIPTSIIEQSRRFTEDEESRDNPQLPKQFENLTESGRRKRKDVNYSAVRYMFFGKLFFCLINCFTIFFQDLMSEREWLRQIDEDWGSDDDDEDVPMLASSSSRKRKGPGSGRKPSAAGSEQSMVAPKRGRKRKKAVEEEVHIV